jgi:hypothetical protein
VSPFAFQHHDVTDPNGIGECDLDSGEDRAERRRLYAFPAPGPKKTSRQGFW